MIRKILLGLVLFFLFSSISYSCEIEKKDLEGSYILKINTPDSNLLENCYKEFIKKETAKGQKAFVMMQSTAYQNEAIIYSSKYNLGDAKENAFFLCNSTFVYNRTPGSGSLNRCIIIKQDDNIIADKRFDTKQTLVEKEEKIISQPKKNLTKIKNNKLEDSLFSKKCEGGLFSKGYKKGTNEFDDCIKKEERLAALEEQKQSILNEEKNKRIALEENKKQKVIQQKQELDQAKIREEQLNISKMKPEDRLAYTCSEKFSFRKGSDKFKDCVFKLYAAEVELEKLELQRQLAKANADAARANAEAARAGAERQERLALAQTEAAKMQSLAARQQAIAANTADSLALIESGLRMMSPQRPAPRMQTTCTYTGRFMNCF